MVKGSSRRSISVCCKENYNVKELILPRPEKRFTREPVHVE